MLWKKIVFRHVAVRNSPATNGVLANWHQPLIPVANNSHVTGIAHKTLCDLFSRYINILTRLLRAIPDLKYSNPYIQIVVKFLRLYLYTILHYMYAYYYKHQSYKYISIFLFKLIWELCSDSEQFLSLPRLNLLKTE